MKNDPLLPYKSRLVINIETNEVEYKALAPIECEKCGRIIQPGEFFGGARCHPVCSECLRRGDEK